MSILDEIQARANAATEGPWAVEVDAEGFDGASVLIDDSGWGTAYICQGLHQGESEGVADAEFIAHAREDVPKLVAALRAVIDLHTSVAPTPSQPWVTCEGCTNGANYPCPTIQALNGVLNG